MKRNVLFEVPFAAISYKVASEGKFYGAEGLSGGKGFVRRSYWGKGTYTVGSISSFTTGNGWNSYDSNNLVGCISNLLNSKGIRVYEFDTFKELAEWLNGEG